MSLASPRVLSELDSATAARDAICDALAMVAGLTVTRSAPVTPAPGCTWPKWALTNYTGGTLLSVASHEFDVLVLLPNSGDPGQLTSDADDLLSRVVAALWPVGVITTAQPASVVFDNNQSMPALQVRVIPHLC